MTAITITRHTKPLAILKEMRHLLSDPERWTQRAFARGKSGRKTATNSRYAVRWCIDGALARCCRTEKACWVARGHLSLENPLGVAGNQFGSMLAFNDYITTTHADVLNLLDRTIARLEAQP